MKIGAAYIRVSTDDQLEFSPDSQLHKIKAFAKSNDIILSDEHIYMEDEGRSGRDAKNRPEFQRMIGTAKLKPKPFDIILVWKFSRFARNREDSIVYKSMLRKQCGIDVVSVSENVGDDKMSILIEAIIEAMDEWYSVNLAEEVVRGMSEKARRGGVVSAPAFGYTIGDNVFIPHEEEAPIVQLIFNKYVNDGLGCFEISNMLNTMGIKNKRGNRWENRTIDYLLRNPVYIGKIRWSPNGRIRRDYKRTDYILADGHHEPIISEELFQKAQKKLSATKAKYPKYARVRTNPEFMLKGLVRCSNCGATLARAQEGLQCHRYTRGDCNVSHYISMPKINQRVIDLVERSFQSGNLSFTVKPPVPVEDSGNALEAQIEKERQKLERVKAAYADGIDSLEEYKENKRTIQAAIQELKKQIQPATKKVTAKEFIERNKSLLKVLKNPNSSESEKNKALLTCVDKIVFDRTANTLKIFFYAS